MSVKDEQRFYLSLPSDDPRFEELRRYLAAVQQRGRTSPVPRMLGEWALLGFLLTTGRLVLSGGEGTITLPASLPDPQEVQALTEAVEAALGEFQFD